MAKGDEIAAGVFRISVYAPEAGITLCGRWRRRCAIVPAPGARFWDEAHEKEKFHDEDAIHA